MAHFALNRLGTASSARSSSYRTRIAEAVTSLPDSEPVGQAFINGPHPHALALDGEWRQTSYSGSFRGCFAGLGYTFDGTNFIPPAAPEPTP
jgi:hypothetical protein